MRRNKLYHSLILVLGVAVAASVAVLISCKKSEPETNTRLPDAAVSPVPSVKSAKGEMSKLVGRWLRPDVGYVLEIQKVGADGKLDVIYSAPRPVQVGKATATQSGGVIKVIIEIKDPSLAGSTYTMTFDSQAERLNGVYHQAALGENSDIFFVRE